MGELFYVHYQPKTMLVQTLNLSLQAELAYRRLGDWAWAEGEMPLADVPTLARISRCTVEEWAQVGAELKSAGWRVVRKRFFHPVVHAVLCRARTANKENSRKAQYAAKARWRKKALLQGPETAVEPSCSEHAPSMPRGDASSMLERCHERLTSKRTINEKDIKQLNGELISLSGSPLLQENGEENRFLNELARTLSTFDSKQSSREMTNWGGWWRLRYRENAQKAWRVLAEVRSMIKEGRIHRNPGAAAKDLWERFQ